MALNKRTYVDQETVITAQNLNDIQDAIIENEEAIEDQGEVIEGKYAKPSGGIPASDMASAVQTSLGKAESAYQKPSGGIPASDMASGVQTSLGKAESALQSSDIDSTLTVAGKAADAKKTGDEISDVKNTLNHKADLIYDTASGDIASFPDGADGLPVKDLTVAIEPVQPGTGDPSPTNVRPISGWTGANVDIAGENIVDITNIEQGGIGNNGQNYDTQPDRQVRTKDYIPVKPDTSYTLMSVVDSSISVYQYVYFYRNDKTFIRNDSRTQGGNYTFTTPLDCCYLRFKFYASSEGSSTSLSPSKVTSLWLGFESSAGSFDPYVGNNLTTITWQSSAGTVYGGTLDVTTGVLTVDRVCHTYKGGTDSVISSYAYDSNNNCLSIRSLSYPHVITNNSDTTIVKPMSDKLKTITFDSMSTSTDYAFASQGNWAPAFAIKVPGYTTSQEYDAWCAANEPQISWLFASPIEITLTPTQIDTLLGQNNIWADCGPSTVEYPADTKLYIQKINTPTDDDMIADANIASGKYFIVNNNLYLSTAAILAGDPIKPGTNCTLTNLAAALNAINS